MYEFPGREAAYISGAVFRQAVVTISHVVPEYGSSSVAPLRKINVNNITYTVAQNKSVYRGCVAVISRT